MLNFWNFPEGPMNPNTSLDMGNAFDLFLYPRESFSLCDYLALEFSWVVLEVHVRRAL